MKERLKRRQELIRVVYPDDTPRFSDHQTYRRSKRDLAAHYAALNALFDMAAKKKAGRQQGNKRTAPKAREAKVASPAPDDSGKKKKKTNEASEELSVFKAG